MKKFLSLVGILLFSTGLYSEQNPRTKNNKLIAETRRNGQ
jgi:hypothetical protein